MSSYRYRFVGYEKLPSGMNADDVQLHCRLPDELIREIRNSGYAKRYHLGLAVQLSFLALTGRNADAALKMPSAMLKMLCEQLGIHSTAIASLKSLYSNADRTLSNHRAWVREQLLFSTYDSNAEERLKAALSQQGRFRLRDTRGKLTRRNCSPPARPEQPRPLSHRSRRRSG